VTLKINRFQLTPAAAAEIDWLQATLDRESRKFGTRVMRTSKNHLTAFRSGTTRGDAQ
jgi:poly-gamma-glutamate capsule biosynthesis protein CapA/YwtB (metallophosphatase superfamily)